LTDKCPFALGFAAGLVGKSIDWSCAYTILNLVNPVGPVNPIFGSPS